MKRKFDTLRETLDEFAQQDEFPLLVLGCHSESLAYVLNFFQALEQTLPSHLVAAFHQPFHSPAQWIDAILEALRLQLEVITSERAAKGEPPPPALPMDLEDGRCPAPERLASLLRYLASLLPNQADYRVVIGLMPLECRDLEAFSALMATLIPTSVELPAGVSALRIVVWDEYERAGLRTALTEQRCAFALAYADDFSTPALTDALGTDAADRDLPLAERMASLQQLAALDYAYERYPDALDKYALLHAFHHERSQPELEAVALLGAGDTLFAAGDPVGARERLQQGIVTAMACKSLPALSNLLTSVTDVSMALGLFADAESYADSGTKVAAAALNPFVYADMFERRGDAELAQGRSGDAVASYTRCRELCRTYGHYPRWYTALEKQAQIYAQANMEPERRELERELAQAQALEQGGGAPT